MRSKRVIGPLGVGALILGAWMLIFAPMLDRRRALSEDLAQGLRERNQLALRVAELERGTQAAVLDPEFVWGTRDQGSAVTEVQQTLIGIAKDQELGFRALGSGPRVALGNYSRVSISVEIDGYLEQVVPMIAELEAHRPALRIARMTIRHAPRIEQDRPGTPVSLNMEVWAVAERDDQP